jgi:tRNA dimethylallyltransferase
VAGLVAAVLGPTASGKSALGIALAERLSGEIVNCDSTAVYRGFNIGTDKVPVTEQRGIPHHLIDVAEPTEVYSAARFVRDASTAIRDIHGRGRLPILVGGTGLYYRALTRGLFPGPGADESLRARLVLVADRRGAGALHRWLSKVDPAAGVRVMPGDLKRLVRALEVYLLTGRPLTEHFASTVSPIADCRIVALALQLPPALTETRIRQRVKAQFVRGVVPEVEGLLARGVPATARPFGGLVYRQILDMLAGQRDESATRALIVQENRRYAKRQLIWFRKEPNLIWFDGPGEAEPTLDAALATLRVHGILQERESG